MDAMIRQMLKDWPDSWNELKGDQCIGKRIAQELIAFVKQMQSSNLSKKTIRKHVDNLWLLGGEIIRLTHQEKVENDLSGYDMLMLHLDHDGGPLVYHSEDSEQESFDATCRKLYKYLLPKKNGKASPCASADVDSGYLVR